MNGGILLVNPNPFSSSFLVSGNFTSELENAEVVVTDVTGRIITKQKLLNGAFNLRFDLEDQQNGVYFIILQNNGQQIDSKKL